MIPEQEITGSLHVCNYLALMSFGRTMCDLVTSAKNGNDDDFCHAVQIDRTVLFGIPYFRQRLIRAQVGYEAEFLHKLGEAVKGSILRKKLSYPELMLVFAMLDDEGLLDMPLNELMDVCEELGVYGREHGTEDIDSLRKRRQYYRKMTGTQKSF
ncbi:MAG: hypothetical protein ACO1PZ_04305 [Gammaproteobacteria bacterium]